MTKAKNTSTAAIIIAYLLIYIVWGSTYFFIHIALQGFTPFLLGAIRFTIAGTLLLIWCNKMKEPIWNKQLLKTAAVTGILLLFIDMGLVMKAQQYLPSSLIAIVAASTAIWILLLDKKMWKVNFRNWNTVVGVIVGFVGVILLFSEQLAASFTETGLSNKAIGMCLLILGTLSWASGSVYSKYSVLPSGVTFANAAWQMLIAGILFWGAAFAHGDVQQFHMQATPVSSWLAIGYLIIFGSILAFTSYIWLLKVRPATEVSTHAYVNPLVAVFLGSTFANEQVTLIQIIGLAIILCGVAMINFVKAKKGKQMKPLCPDQ
ncbi:MULTISPECIES: EamA family transporter [Olivibacter]|jgi:drug/metabolite transporter (DMT)-like permease|uniref:EamA family transporter n=1 Tax=Olivibacter oleidegradans TaxID=760123 RepID=A0ABV6HR15_9SPHI|nr:MULTISPECIES: EamA family transporter [unclassified Olivibacter]MDM8174347.1 EamA family transporter [Olivibacter sp. 47]QEL04161.1 EamA family transporter [Olivibacter sp. LS-1]